MADPLSKLPTLETERLRLRAFVPGDAPQVQRLAGAWEIAATTANIPHPYQDGAAEAWIATHRQAFAQQEAATFAIVLKPDLTLIGAIGLGLDPTNRAAELGYWIGVPYWNRGYCTEAGKAVLAFGFEALDLHRIMARHMTKNPASGQVLQKLGMTYEGTQRGSILRWGSFEDAAVYAILKGEYRT
ncbi:MAG TPA: GNAT family N-acetyltransferase [Anaerolineales bacterium]|nr:GNAT family N-acetyltransferase [Anaerolineales bacterium]